MIGFSLLQLSFTIIAVSMSFLKMGQLFANKWQQMCAITGDHVYFITEASLQICICIVFDPIWKPDAVVVESGLSIEIVNNKARHNLIEQNADGVRIG